MSNPKTVYRIVEGLQGLELLSPGGLCVLKGGTSAGLAEYAFDCGADEVVYANDLVRESDKKWGI